MEITGCEVWAIRWMIRHFPAELLQEMRWPSNHVWPSFIVQQDNISTKHPSLPVLNALSQFLQCFAVTLSIHRLTSGQEVDKENAPSSQNTVHIIFCAEKVCLNFVLQSDPLWCQCIDCCLVSSVMCVTHISSSVMIWSRNSSPSSWYCCRNVSADSMHFALCSGISCFGTYLVHNFLNNRCSVTILCKKMQEICGKWLLISITVKLMHSCTSSCEVNAFLHKFIHNGGWPPTCAPEHTYVVDLL